MIVLTCLFMTAVVVAAETTDPAAKYGTITEKTPSIPQYFSWINNTNEGPTEAQTLTNLQFFKWLHDEYGMRLGIYAFDAGTIDSQNYYGRMDTERFKSQFPDGFGRVAELAKSFDCRLGLWGGPDGFGDTPQEATSARRSTANMVRTVHSRRCDVEMNGSGPRNERCRFPLLCSNTGRRTETPPTPTFSRSRPRCAARS